MNNREEIISVAHDTKKDVLEVVRREYSNRTYLNGKAVPDKIYKEIWGVVEGKLSCMHTVIGKHGPEHTVGESFIFD